MTSPTALPRRVRSPRGQAASLREEILSAALTCIDEGGVRSLTLRGLGRTVGVSAPAIYAHFANTDAILLAVAERLFGDLATRLAAAVEQHGADEPKLRLHALCRSYLDYAETHPGRYLVMFGGQWDARAAVEHGAVDSEPVLDLGQNVLTSIGAAVDACTESPGVGTPVKAVSVWVLLHGYAHQHIVSSAFPWPAGMTDHLLDEALRMSR